MIRAISERVLMGGDDAADEDALFAETPARWKPSAAEIAHLDVCTLGPEGCVLCTLHATHRGGASVGCPHFLFAAGQATLGKQGTSIVQVASAINIATLRS